MRYVQAIARPSDRAKLKGVKLAGVAVVVTMLLTGVATSAGAASGPINIAGQWQTSFQCTSGPCTPGDKSDLLTITQAAGSNTISGTDQHGRAIAGTLTGLDLVITVSKGNFVATADVAVSANGQSWSGTLSDTIGTSGTETGTRVSGGARQSTTGVFCDLEDPSAPNALFTCTAIVGDARGVQPQVAPTGTVSFALAAGAPGGLQQSSCALSSSSGSTAFCSVQYGAPSGAVPAGSQPSLTATYGGDAALDPSTGQPTAAVTSQTGQAAISQMIDQDANACLAEAEGAPATTTTEAGQGMDHLLPDLTSPPSVQYQPTDTSGVRLLKTCFFPIRGVGYAVGGLAYGGGMIAGAAGNPYVAGTTMAAGAATFGYGMYAGPAAPAACGTGATIFAVGAVNYYIAQPIGSALNGVGNIVINDPPDPHFLSPVRPQSVAVIAVPKGSPALVREVVAMKLDASHVHVDLAAMETAIDRAGGAAQAHDRAAEGAQARSAIAFGKSAKIELAQLLTAEHVVVKAMASYARSFKPLSAAELAKAKADLAGGAKIPALALAILKQFGISPAALRKALAKARPGAALPGTVEISPAFSGDVAFGEALLALYPKVPQIESEARLH